MTLVHALLLSVLWSGSPASELPEPAGVETSGEACVLHSGRDDSLSSIDLAVLKGSLEEVLREAGLAVGSTCQESWRVVHTTHGSGVLISLRARGREVAAAAPDLASIPGVYVRLVNALISGEELEKPQEIQVHKPPRAPEIIPLKETFNGAVLPPPDPTPWYLYLNLGLAGVPRLLEDSAGVAGLGYRYSRGHWGIDLSNQVFNLSSDGFDDSFDDFNDVLVANSLLRVRGYFLGEPDASSSLYGLAGLGWGFVEGELAASGFDIVAGEGAELHLSLGYETGREDSLRFLFELGLVWPLYELDNGDLLEPLDVGPIVSFTAGLGWTKTRTKRWRH